MNKSFFEYSKTKVQPQQAQQGNNFEKSKDFNNQNTNSSKATNSFDGAKKSHEYNSASSNSYKNKAYSGEQNNFGGKPNNAGKNHDFTSQKGIEETYNQFKNMDKNELLQTLYGEVDKQKSNGTFNPQKLEQAINNMSGYLTPEQQNNMKEMLKNFR